LRSSWTDPDEGYEAAVIRFVHEVHDDSVFRKEMAEFSRGIAPAALVNSLASVVLKVCSPGVPDFYQGTELVHPTLTDPDNRGPIDFAARADVLSALPAPSASAASDLLLGWVDGHLKAYVTRTLLHDRRNFAALYARGSYEPLATSTAQVVAFQRNLDGDSLICVVPRLTYLLAGPGNFPTGMQVWGRDTMNIPGELPNRYRDLLTDRLIEPRHQDAPLSEVLDVLPVAVLRTTTT
jgi:(1->4)-alpha-D-glucan 1-alpha-D-glucosylmutase